MVSPLCWRKSFAAKPVNPPFDVVLVADSLLESLEALTLGLSYSFSDAGFETFGSSLLEPLVLAKF